MNDVLVHSDCGNRDQEKRGADVTLTIDAALQEQAYKDIKKYKGSVVAVSYTHLGKISRRYNRIFYECNRRTAG